MWKYGRKFCAIGELLNNKQKIDFQVEVAGWVRTRRDSKAGVSFITVNDGSSFDSLQIIVSNTLANYNKEVLHITAGCSVIARGKLVNSPGNKQSLELQAENIEIIGWVEDPERYPISPKYHTLEYLREYSHLRVRTNTIGAITRIRHALSMAIHRFFNENGFYWIHTPIITSSDCEGAGQMFKVTTFDLTSVPRNAKGAVDFSQDFFARESFLTVSGQLNVESYCEAMTKVYTFGTTFRAENSNTSRHLAEFWMVEPEIAFADLEDNARLAADFIVYLVKAMLSEREDDLRFFSEKIDKDCLNRLEKVASSEFIYMEYTEAIEILKKASRDFVFPVSWGMDLQTEHERYLTEEITKCPIILVNYPKEIKGFYMRANEDNRTVAAMDILVPGIGEILGGSQREERYDILCQRIDEVGLDRQIYGWYLDLRRYGTVPHSGFGLGLERMIMYVTGMQNIRDVIPFPRVARHADY